MSDLSSDVCSSDLWTTDNDAFQQTLRAGRLQKLKHLGLAEEVRPGEWRLAGGIEETPKRMGERGDIIKMMPREMRSDERCVGKECVSTSRCRRLRIH